MNFLPEVREGKILEPRHVRRIKNQKFILRLAPEKKKRRKFKNWKQYKLGKLPKKYREYIKSPWWIVRKARFYKKYGKKCAVCLTTKNIDLHHMVYGNLGNEKDEHLVALCRIHHDQFHDKIGVKGNMLKETHQFIIDEREILEFPRL